MNAKEKQVINLYKNGCTSWPLVACPTCSIYEVCGHPVVISATISGRSGVNYTAIKQDAVREAAKQWLIQHFNAEELLDIFL